MRDWQQLIEDHVEEEVSKDPEELTLTEPNSASEPNGRATAAIEEEEAAVGSKRSKRLCRRSFREFLSRASEIRQRHKGSGRDNHDSSL